MKVEIINVWERQDDGINEARSVSPLTAAYLAALFPSDIDVSIRHEIIRPVNYEIDVDLVAITFLIGNAIRAYEIADRFRERGIPVIMGGPHVSLLPEEALKHSDAVVVGEAENVLLQLIKDFKHGTLKSIYKSEKPHDLKGLPVPRYDLIEKEFLLNRSIQATRGCPYYCDFCSVKAFNYGFRTRPIEEVITEIGCYDGRNYLQNKMVWFWDNNLIGDKRYAKELFREMIPLKKWWFSQLSIDMAKDKELVRLAGKSGCAGVFVGIESFSQESLKQIKKNHNKIADYKRAIETFHENGIYVMAGVIIGFDEDTVESIKRIPDFVQESGIDIAFIHILTPNYGTALYDRYNSENRLLTKDWSQYNGFNAVFQPRNMSIEELHNSYLEVWEEIHSLSNTFVRIFRNVPKARFRSFSWSFFDNGYYCLLNHIGKFPLVGVKGQNERN